MVTWRRKRRLSLRQEVVGGGSRKRATFHLWVVAFLSSTRLTSGRRHPATTCADRPFEREADFLISSCESCTITRPTLEYLYLTFLPARGSVSRAASPPASRKFFTASRENDGTREPSFFFLDNFLMLKVDFFCGKGENK